MKVFLLALVLLSIPTVHAMPEMPGQRDGRHCESYLLSSKDDLSEYDSDTRVRMAAAELLLFMIMEHPIQLQLSMPKENTPASDLRDLLHYSMGGAARITANSRFMGVDKTGFNKVVKNQTPDFKAFLDKVDLLRNRKYFETLKEDEIKEISRKIVDATIAFIKSVSSLDLYSRDEYGNRDAYIFPTAHVSQTTMGRNNGPNNLNVREFDLFSKAQKDRLRLLSDFYQVIFLRHPHIATKKLKRGLSVDEAENAKDLAATFLRYHLPDFLEARAKIYESRGQISGYGQIGGIWGAIQDNTYESTRRKITFWIRDMALNKQLKPVTALPTPFEEVEEQIMLFVEQRPRMQDWLMSSQSSSDRSLQHFRDGMKIFDDLIESLPEPPDLDAVGRLIHTPPELKEMSGSLLNEVTEQLQATQFEIDSIEEIASETKTFAEGLSDYGSEVAKNATPIQRQEIGHGQVNMGNTIALIVSRRDRNLILLEALTDLQSLIREYRNQSKLGAEVGPLADQILQSLEILKSSRSQIQAGKR